MKVLAVIPAYNEEESIANTVVSLLSQSVRPDKVVIAVNNSTDRTFELASEISKIDGSMIEVLDLGVIPEKKAGALNQALDLYLEPINDYTHVLVMDGDTTLSQTFIEDAVNQINNNPDLGAVCGRFVGRKSDSFLGFLQELEYHRYGQQPKRHNNRTFVLSGTATLFDKFALRLVRAYRSVGVFGEVSTQYFDTHSLTEDNEITLALQTLEYDVHALPDIYSETDVMTTVKSLASQRHRWYLGAIRNLFSYGKKLPWNLRWFYWRQQFGLAVAAVVTLMTFVIGVVAASAGTLSFAWWMFVPVVLEIVYRTASVWSLGWKARLTAFALLPEMVYSWLLTAFYARAALAALRGSKGTWVAT